MIRYPGILQSTPALPDEKVGACVCVCVVLLCFYFIFKRSKITTHAVRGSVPIFALRRMIEKYTFTAALNVYDRPLLITKRHAW